MVESAEAMAKRGPYKPEDEKLTKRLNFMVRPDQFEAYERAAKDQGISIADWLRKLADRAAKNYTKNHKKR